MAVDRLLPAFRSVGRAVVDPMVLLHGCDLPLRNGGHWKELRRGRRTIVQLSLPGERSWSGSWYNHLGLLPDRTAWIPRYPSPHKRNQWYPRLRCIPSESFASSLPTADHQGFRT